jgi:hypothetical protein
VSGILRVIFRRLGCSKSELAPDLAQNAGRRGLTGMRIGGRRLRRVRDARGGVARLRGQRIGGMLTQALVLRLRRRSIGHRLLGLGSLVHRGVEGAPGGFPRSLDCCARVVPCPRGLVLHDVHSGRYSLLRLVHH